MHTYRNHTYILMTHGTEDMWLKKTIYRTVGSEHWVDPLARNYLLVRNNEISPQLNIEHEL